MDDYLTKPLQLAALAQALERWTAPARPDGAASAPSPATSIAEPELMDFARLEEFREFDDEALTMTREVIALFLADTPARLEAIAKAIAAADATALTSAGHALKGAAGNVGAVAMPALGRCARSPGLRRNSRRCRARLARLRDLWEATRAALASWA